MSFQLLIKGSYTKRNTFACFPFHTTCYEILARAIFGNPDTTRIDKYAMYMAMQQIQVASGSRQHLGLDYGEIGGMDRTWSSVPGEEVGSPFNQLHQLDCN